MHIDRCAKALKAHGVKQGEIISMSLPNTPEAVYLFYAISKVGAIANLIDPRTNSEGIADHINETTSTKLFVIDMIVDKIVEIIDQTTLQSRLVRYHAAFYCLWYRKRLTFSACNRTRSCAYSGI